MPGNSATVTVRCYIGAFRTRERNYQNVQKAKADVSALIEIGVDYTAFVFIGADGARLGALKLIDGRWQ